jgi:ABC-type glycerol-3-phosphate transport system substrate-binding protein
MSKHDKIDDDLSDENKSRRDFLKIAGVTTATGALGTLAGCAGDGDGNGGGGGGNGGGNGGNGGGGGSESVTINFLSANAAENSKIRQHYGDSMKLFEEQKGNVNVALQTASYGDVKTKIASTVQAGTPPALAEAGSAGLALFREGKVPNHGPWIKETEGYPKEWTAANQAAANFRGEWWSGGAPRHTNSNLGINPKLFSQVGVKDPHSELKTWSGLLENLKKVDEQTDAYAYEVTGAWNDLESYWGEAHTSYTDGTDPWIRGDPKDPTVIIGGDHEDSPKTDGMIENNIKLAKEFSSSKAAARTDEEIPALLLTDRVAAFSYATPNVTRWTTVKPDVKIGWHGGEGDFMLLPNPKVDPEYGANFGISDLEGVKGQHGGQLWAFEQQHSVFKVSDKKQDLAWDLNVFLHREPKFVFPAWGKYYESFTGDAVLFEELLKWRKEQGLKAQNYQQSIENVNKYGGQYASTGAAWDVNGTDEVRWNNINRTISQAIAGQHKREETPSIIRDRVLKSLGGS